MGILEQMKDIFCLKEMNGEWGSKGGVGGRKFCVGGGGWGYELF